MEIEGGNLCQYFCRINASRNDAIATRGNLRLDRTNKRFEGAVRDLLLNKTFIQHDAGEKTIKNRFHCAIAQRGLNIHLQTL